jgi:pimeloyl-ACP methyl ester carboxylesterase
MTGHYFEHELARLHYYKFGTGKKNMLCFHGFGMHGKQFKSLEQSLGAIYTFWGFDLFFHKQTILKDQSLAAIKKGLSKKQLANLIADFCEHEHIGRFSVIGYSMGSHYATAITEQLSLRIDEYIIAAPSSINPGNIVRFFGKNKFGNKLLQKLMLNEKAVLNLISVFKRLRIIDEIGRDILYKEVGTAELRFALYACFTYLRYLETDESKLIKALEDYQIKSIFLFGKYDKMYLPRIGKSFFKKLPGAKIIILDENHEMIKPSFASRLSDLLL